MIVPSVQFLLFAAAAALVFNLSRSLHWRRGTLLIVNGLFLATFSRSVMSYLPLAAFLGLGFFALSVTRKGAAPRLFVGLLIATVAVFFWLKRYSFIPSSLFLPIPYLLVGLSYIFFRVLHLIIDNHQGSVEQKVGVLSFLNYTLNFTSLTSGPIQRYEDYHAMETQSMPLDLIVIGTACERVVLGYFKVAIVSMALSLAQRQAIAALDFAQPLGSKVGSGILIAAVYPIYLYFNFSGYVDVVIGVARLFRITLPENFDRPFSSENFISFWSRWHITLSNWLKTYVYNPLMMFAMQRIRSESLAPYLSVVAFFVTFFLVGLWHGQTSEFLFFGFLQGGGVALNKLYQLKMQNILGRKRYRELARNSLYRAACRGLTFTWFAFTLFWFWSSWGQIAGFCHFLGPSALLLVWLSVFVIATTVLAALTFIHQAAFDESHMVSGFMRSRYTRTACTTALCVITVAIVLLMNSPAPDIVYKTF